MACGVGCAKTILILINVAFMLIGGCLAALAGYALNVGSQLTAVIPASALTVALIASGSLMLFSILGCAAAKYHRRCFLFLYATALLIILATELVAAALILSFLHLVNGISADSILLNQTAVVSAAEQDFITSLNDTYEFCCVQHPSAPACSWLSNVAPGCVEGVGLNGTVPGAGLIQFKADIQNYLQSHFHAFSLILIVLGVVQALALFSACHLSCTKPAEPLSANLLPYQQVPHARPLTQGVTYVSYV